MPSVFDASLVAQLPERCVGVKEAVKKLVNLGNPFLSSILIQNLPKPPKKMSNLLGFTHVLDMGISLFLWYLLWHCLCTPKFYPKYFYPGYSKFFSVHTRRVEIGHILCSRSWLYIYIYVYIYQFPVCFNITRKQGTTHILKDFQVLLFCWWTTWDNSFTTTMTRIMNLNLKSALTTIASKSEICFEAGWSESYDLSRYGARVVALTPVEAFRISCMDIQLATISDTLQN